MAKLDSGICENVDVREDELRVARVVIEPCATCRDEQINYGANGTVEKYEQEIDALRARVTELEKMTAAE